MPGWGGWDRGRARGKAKQVWEIGRVVKVGVLRRLTITGGNAREGWLLRGPTGNEYRFIPHQGIERLS